MSAASMGAFLNRTWDQPAGRLRAQSAASAPATAELRQDFPFSGALPPFCPVTPPVQALP